MSIVEQMLQKARKLVKKNSKKIIVNAVNKYRPYTNRTWRLTKRLRYEERKDLNMIGCFKSMFYGVYVRSHYQMNWVKTAFKNQRLQK